jgi:hypothetical protein
MLPLAFKCPACQELGLTSRVNVTESDVKSSIEETECFFDEFGLYHEHNPDPIWLEFHCSNGHSGSITPCSCCPHCEYGEHSKARLFGQKIQGVVAEYHLCKHERSA